MKPSNVKLALKTVIAAKQPAYLWGAPGVGKSQVVAQVAAELGLQLVDVRAVLLDPVDLRGLPHVNGDGRAHWAIPEFLPRDGAGILFLDELNAAPPLVQAACYQLVLDRKLGDYELPAGWTIIAAGNRESDRAVTSRMPTPLANRFLHIDFDIDVNDWAKWAVGAGLEMPVVGFVRFRPNLLHEFDARKNNEGAAKAFPSPRSWEFVSNILKNKPAKEIEYDLVAGAVGQGAAAELLGFLRIFRGLPNPDLVIMNPDKADVPTDPATLYALCGALSRKASDQTIGRLVQYADRIPAEFSVLLINDCIEQNPALADTDAFNTWSIKHADIMI